MDENQRTQIETYLTHLDGLIRRGRQVRDTLATDPSSPSAIGCQPCLAGRLRCHDQSIVRRQQAHWLARSFSGAFLDALSGRSCRRRGGANRDSSALARRPRASRRHALWNGRWLGRFRILGCIRTSEAARHPAGLNSFTTPIFGLLLSRLTLIVEAPGARNYDLALRTSCGILESRCDRRAGKQRGGCAGCLWCGPRGG